MNADAKADAAYKKGFLRGQALDLIQCGVTVSEVSDRLNVSRRTIYYIGLCGGANSQMGREQVDPESLLADQIA